MCVCIFFFFFFFFLVSVFSCSYPTDGVFANNQQKGKEDVDDANNKYSYKTPAFEAFRFLKGNGIKFTCKIEICGDGDSRCDVRVLLIKHN